MKRSFRKRTKLTRKASRKNFRKNAGVKPKNMAMRMRGGFRL